MRAVETLKSGCVEESQPSRPFLLKPFNRETY